MEAEHLHSVCWDLLPRAVWAVAISGESFENRLTIFERFQVIHCGRPRVVIVITEQFTGAFSVIGTIAGYSATWRSSKRSGD